jgi:thiamine-phosphate diphosphorylase
MSAIGLVMPHVPLRGIYGIVDRDVASEPFALLDALLDAGVRVVQYRAKSGVDPQIVRAMHAVTRARGALLIVNDDLACALEADGWHAGQEDLADHDLATIRATLGSRIFGVSCGVASEALVAERFGADYVGVGPYAATGTKADAGAAIGEAGVRAVVGATSLPVVAIGGIDADNLAGVARSGAAMAAVISAIARAADPASAARDLVARWSALAP